MKLIKLTKKEMLEIYNTHMVNDFPSNELKPFDIIVNLLNQNMYFAYGLYENDKLFAYVFLCKTCSSNYLLLDYFAVCSNMRGRGIGSKCLSLLNEECKEYDGIFIEVENPKYSDNKEEIKARNRRILFYERNKFYHTDILCKLFEVEMIVMVMNIKKSQVDSILYNELMKIYDTMFGKKLCDEKIVLSRTSSEADY